MLVNAGLSCVDEEDHGTGRQLEGEHGRAVSLVVRGVAAGMSRRRLTMRCSRSCACSHDKPHVRCSHRPLRSRIVLPKRVANESRHLRADQSENQRERRSPTSSASAKAPRSGRMRRSPPSSPTMRSRSDDHAARLGRYARSAQKKVDIVMAGADASAVTRGHSRPQTLTFAGVNVSSPR